MGAAGLYILPLVFNFHIMQMPYEMSHEKIYSVLMRGLTLIEMCLLFMLMEYYLHF